MAKTIETVAAVGNLIWMHIFGIMLSHISITQSFRDRRRRLECIYGVLDSFVSHFKGNPLRFWTMVKYSYVPLPNPYERNALLDHWCIGWCCFREELKVRGFVRKIICTLIILICFLSDIDATFAYNIQTHKQITQQAVNLSNINTYLNVDLSINLDSLLHEKDLEMSKSADDWIIAGSGFEDKPPTFAETGILDNVRFNNHFHNPLTNMGLTDRIDLFAESARTWAISSSGNKWSWNEARSYLYDALTSSSMEEREDNFAKLFRSLGQVTHLIQDMAVPAHVRNDNHGVTSVLSGFSSRFDFYESIVERTVDPLSFNVSPFAFGTDFPLGNFWDTETYVDIPTLQPSFVGLSEFTSYNFLSEDTIFTEDFAKTDKHYFPHPRKEFTDAVLKEELAEDGTTDQVYYVLGYGTVRLAAYSYFHRPLADQGLLGYVRSGWDYDLDESVVRNNANILVPKAISYSAGLLNYFFRGQLEVTIVHGGLKVKNVSSEAMGPGFIVIYYDDTTSNRNYLAYTDVASPLDPGAETGIIEFDRPTNNIKPGQYIVVFQGQLGAEEGAVIGKVTSPQKIYYVSKRSGIYKIYSMDADGSNPSVVYDNPDPNITISKLAPSPDGETLAFTVTGPQIYLLDLTSGSLSQLTQGDWPDWSPDGAKMAFERDTVSTGVQIFIRNLQTGDEIQLTPTIQDTHVVSSRHPAFSPDGAKIAFTRGYPDGEGCWPDSFAIYLMDTSGNYLGPLTCDPQGPWIDEAPTWSPDGQEIAFTRRWDRQSPWPFEKLHKVSVNTKAVTKLTNADWDTYSELTPAWSSDGKYIAIGSNQGGNFDILLVDPDSGAYVGNLTYANSDIDGFPAYLK
jgi:Tol biopolymer transport system component